MFLAVVVFGILLLTGSPIAVFADDAADELNNNIAGLLAGLDLSALDEYIKNYAGNAFDFGNSAAEIIEYLLNGNYTTDYGGYLNELFSVLFGDALSFLPVLGVTAAVALLSAVVANSEGGIIGGSTAKIVRLACTAMIVFLLASLLAGIVSECTDCITGIKRQVEVITPILITLTVLTGGTSSAAIYQPSAVFLTGGAVELISGFEFPAVIVCSILNFTSRLSPDMSFSGVSKLIKSIVKWAIGITATVFGIFITVQGGASSLFDGILFKTTKYLVGNSIPIVGGFISGGMDTLTAAGLLIKSSVGTCGIIILLFEVLEPVILLAALSLMLKFMGAIVQPLGESALCGLFGDIANDVEYFVAGLIMASFMYALVIMLMINSANSFI